ncbi:MAG: ribosomal RNA small subunit methyltransferase A [Candidatus Omnitrophota bacterium]|nr:MAG: ribosomal RNA small subunit methyltransferase A [Candidatus Omnitrophota bacterium]
MRLSKSFGQVFLKDTNYIKKIVNALDIDGKEVLEIGSGDGRISELLAPRVKFLYCVELDLRFCNLLEEKFKGSSGVKIIHQDILKFPLTRIDKKLIIFGNIPYQISNELIRYLITNREHIDCAYLTFQKEFVSKLEARPSMKAYGFLSCYVQFYAKVEKLFDIPNKAFVPVPEVDSSFMRMEFYSEIPYKIDNAGFLFKVIKAAFSKRRKKIINSLPFPKDKLIEILSSLNLSTDVRPENLSLEDYVKVANKLYKI